jgi:hypothetical protein
MCKEKENTRQKEQKKLEEKEMHACEKCVEEMQMGRRKIGKRECFSHSGDFIIINAQNRF